MSNFGIYFFAVKPIDGEYSLFAVSANDLFHADRVVQERILSGFYDGVRHESLILDGYRVLFPSLVHGLLITNPDLEHMPAEQFLKRLDAEAIAFISEESVRFPLN